MRKYLVLFLSVILFMNPVVLAGNIENNISDKILISIDEVVLSDTKFKHSSFFNLKIYNNDDVACRLGILAQQC